MEIKEPLEEIEKQCTIYVHRVNTIEKAESLVKEYKGIETDIIFDSNNNRFYVKHDMGDDTRELYLDELLEAIKNILLPKFGLILKI